LVYYANKYGSVLSVWITYKNRQKVWVLQYSNGIKHKNDLKIVCIAVEVLNVFCVVAITVNLKIYFCF